MANKPFKVDFENRITAKIDNLSSWYLQVSSNTIFRNLKGKVEFHLPTETDHEGVVDCIAALIAIVAIQTTHKFPAGFHDWESPTHWDDILMVVSNSFKTNRMYSKWLDRHILKHANLIPTDQLKRAREMLINDKDGSPQKKHKFDAGFLEGQLREKNARIVELMQEVERATTVVDTSRT